MTAAEDPSSRLNQHYKHVGTGGLAFYRTFVGSQRLWQAWCLKTTSDLENR